MLAMKCKKNEIIYRSRMIGLKEEQLKNDACLRMEMVIDDRWSRGIRLRGEIENELNCLARISEVREDVEATMHVLETLQRVKNITEKEGVITDSVEGLSEDIEDVLETLQRLRHITKEERKSIACVNVESECEPNLRKGIAMLRCYQEFIQGLKENIVPKTLREISEYNIRITDERIILENEKNLIMRSPNYFLEIDGNDCFTTPLHGNVNCHSKEIIKIGDKCDFHTLPVKKHKSRFKTRSVKCLKNRRKFNDTLAISTYQDENLLHLIDNLYKKTKAFCPKECLKQPTLPNGYIDHNSLKINSSAALDRHNNSYSSIYCNQMWSGDCKINGDSQDIFLDTFEQILESTTTVSNMLDRKDRICSQYNKSSGDPHRLRIKRDADFDEGFSENESVDDIEHGSLFNKVSNMKARECLRYCGDCDYNSSNSKVPEVLDKYVLDTSSHSDILDSIIQDDDASDSDGGTDILNSVNATVDKFNAIMENTANTTDVLFHSTNDVLYVNDSDYTTNPWMTSMSKNLCDHITPVLVDTPVLSLVKTTLPHKDERIETPPANVLSRHSGMLYNQQPLSLANITNFNQENSSRVLGSSLNIQNWCSYNYNYIPAQTINFQYKHSKNYEVPNSSNYDIHKVSSWLPYISTGNNTYSMATSYHQPLHRVLLPPHVSLQSMNLGSMPHNIIHLPQLFQQPQSSLHDNDYSDRRYLSNNPKLFSTLKNVNDTRVSSANLSPNTNNHSNIPISKNILCQNVFKGSLDKSQRACCFYMRGGCKKEDCEYAHDLSKVTCKFWEKGDCFKADTCPFKHGYQKD